MLPFDKLSMLITLQYTVFFLNIGAKRQGWFPFGVCRLTSSWPACVKLNRNNEELQEVTKRLEAKIDALEKQVEDEWNSQQQLTTDLSVKLNREVWKLKQESPPFVWKMGGLNGFLKLAKKRMGETEFESTPFYSGPVGYNFSIFVWQHLYSRGKFVLKARNSSRSIKKTSNNKKNLVPVL